jgi:hypothetical protein
MDSLYVLSALFSLLSRRGFQALFEIFLPPEVSFRYYMLALAAANVVVCIVLEDVVVEYCVFRRRAKW